MGTRFSYLQEMQDMLTDSSEDNNGDSTSSSSEDEMESASEGHISSDGDIREAEEISIGSLYYYLVNLGKKTSFADVSSMPLTAVLFLFRC